jgi:glycosyltransferase involved in cell wall biosynthesis
VLLTHYGGKRDVSYENEIRRVFPGAVPVWTAAPDSSQTARLLHYLYCLPSRAPFAVRKFTDQAAARQIERLFREKQFDAAVCDFLSASLTFPPRLRRKAVLFQHNVESILWDRMLASEHNWLKKMIYRVEAGKMRRYERSTVAQFQHIIAVSEQDRAYMSRFVPAERISVVPTGVNLGEYRPSPDGHAPTPLVVFTGTMDFEPNVDGVEYFCREIWPQVQKAVPNARFRIVGKKPVAAIQRLASAQIEVTGMVKSVLHHLEEAWTIVVPLRIGGGTRLKIYEAMAAGRAVVSTTIGAEGLEVQHGKNIILADDKEAFAEGVITLLRQPKLRERYERASAELVRRFDWSSVAQRFAEILSCSAQAHTGDKSLPAHAVNGDCFSR